MGKTQTCLIKFVAASSLEGEKKKKKTTNCRMKSLEKSESNARCIITSNGLNDKTSELKEDIIISIDNALKKTTELTDSMNANLSEIDQRFHSKRRVY